MRLCFTSFTFLVALYAAAVAGCDGETVVRQTFTHTTPTVFRNRNGATIKVSTEGLLVGGKFYAAADCSNDRFNCHVFDSKILFITPKVCFMPPMTSWHVGKLTVMWNGYDQGSSSDVVQTTFGNGVGYGFSEIQGKGIESIAYDSTGKYRIAKGEKFYANIPDDRVRDMLYFSPVGPAFMPCTKEWRPRK